MNRRAIADESFDLILSPSKDEVVAQSLPESSILRRAQDEDSGVTPAPIALCDCPAMNRDGERIIAVARSWIGTPYLHQASLKNVGCDCLGLLRGVFDALYGEASERPPPYTADWAEASGHEAMADAARRHLAEISIDEVRAGDVILFRWRDWLPAKHCAIAVTPDSMIHAHDGAAVAEVSIGPWWRRHLAYAFRFPPLPQRF